MKPRAEKAAFAAAFGAVTLATTWIGVELTDHRWFQYAVVIAVPFVLRRAALEIRIAALHLWRRLLPAARLRPVVVRLRGELDAHSAGRTAGYLDTARRAASVGGLTIDLSRVTAVSPAGATALVTTARRAARDGVPVVLRGATPSVHRVLNDAGLSRMVAYEGRDRS